MGRNISTGDGVVDYGAGDLYWGRCGRFVSLLISTGDDVVGNGAMDLYLGRNSRIWCCLSLLGTMLKKMTVYLF